MTTKTQQEALALVRARLDPKHPLFAASREVEAALMGGNLRAYLDSWVLPLLDYCLTGEAWNGQAADIRRDFASRVARRGSYDRDQERRAAALRAGQPEAGPSPAQLGAFAAAAE